MARNTLEGRLEAELAHVEISAAMLRRGHDTVPTMERLKWMQGLLAEAIAIQAKIEKRDARAGVGNAA